MKQPHTTNTLATNAPRRVMARALATTLLLLLAATAHSATLSWSGGGATANWSESANWGFVGTPADGDTLIFSAGQPKLANNNNIAGLTVSHIRFVGPGGGYVIGGNAFTLTNGIAADNTAGANTLNNAITLGNIDHPIGVVSGASLTLAGKLSGVGGIVKSGPGTLTLSGSGNTYAGDTTLNEGVLQLGKANVIRYGTLTIGDGVGGIGSDIVRFTADLPIYGGPGGSTVVIQSSGLLDFNGFSDDVGPVEMNSGRIDTGTGKFTLFPPLTASGSCIIDDSAGRLGISGSSGEVNVVSGILYVYPEVQGSAAITKTGSGELRFYGANTYSGLTTIEEGILRAWNNLALGATNNGTVVNGAASLYLQNAHVNDEVLTLNSTNASGALQDNGTGDWNGPIILNTDVVIEASSAFGIDGPISGPGGFTKVGGSTLTLHGSDANTYGGTTTVKTGTLVLDKSGGDRAIPGDLVIGDGSGTDTVRYLANNQVKNTAVVTINQGGVFDVNNFIEGIGSLDLTAGTVLTGTGFLDFYGGGVVTRAAATASTISGKIHLYSAPTFDIENGAAANDLLVSAIIESGAITKTGSGNLRLSAANTYSGLTTINGGFIIINNATGLGSAAAGTVLNGGHLSLAGATVVGETLTHNNAGSVLQAGGTSGWGTNVVLNADLQIMALSGGTFDISGSISGTGNITKTQTGTLRFSGNQANTYVGTTAVEAGILELSKTANRTAIPGNLMIGDGSGGANADVVRLLVRNQIADNSDVQIASSGLFDLSTFYDTIDELGGTGNMTFGVSGFLSVGSNNGSSTFDGLASGPGYAGGYTLRKLGTGTFTLTGNNTYENQSRVDAGTLIINGSQPKSPLYVYNNSATAAGIGTVGDIRLVGNLRPGNSPGTLTSSNLFFTSSGDYFVELTGPAAGTEYDRLNVRGTNNLGNAVLHVLPAFTTPVAVGQQFRIINNDSGDAITGTFSGLAEGASLTAADYGFTISYTGGSGNDVVLTLTELPAAALGGLSGVIAGNGNGTIDPNECNLVTVVLTNSTGTPMTGIAATLASATAGVIMTETISAYPDVPGNGTSTNLAPFQVSTTTNFVCGSDVTLELSVWTASHGAFIVPVAIPTGMPATVPAVYDVGVSTNIPDIGTIESTNTVAGFSGPLLKVGVSLWLTHVFTGDLNLSLISPDGVVVDLSSGNGAGANFGAGCAPATSRTTFDDDAATAITAGSPPYVGTFQPEGSLAAVLGGAVNGNWRLRVQDTAGGTLGTLRCWALQLYGADCAPGSGMCELCPEVVLTSATGPDSPVQTGYVAPDGVPSVCGVAKACPGSTTDGPYPTENFTFRNGPADACITIGLEQLDGGHGMVAAAYLGSFDPANPDKCTNYLADVGDIVFVGAPGLFSFDAAANEIFVVNVLAGGYGAYRLTVSGGDCRPALNVSALPGDQAQLDWTTAAAGYGLESTNTLDGVGSPVWSPVTNPPVVIDGRFNVTHDMPAPNQFYRLRKPAP